MNIEMQIVKHNHVAGGIVEHAAAQEGWIMVDLVFAITNQHIPTKSITAHNEDRRGLAIRAH